MWIAILFSISLTMAFMQLTFAFTQMMRGKRSKRIKEMALKSVAAGICERFHAAHPGSKWRWVCRAEDFAQNGGIARIEVMYPSGTQQFMDVCLSTNGYMALHISNAVELTAADTEPTLTERENPENTTETPVPATEPKTGVKPSDEESIIKWYNIVLINNLTNLIDDLNANNEVCIHIGQDGKAYTEDGGNITVVYDFGEMPDVTLWEHITEKLGEEGLFAEVQEGNCIFISWV